MLENIWQKPTLPVKLAENEVHIWRAYLNSSSEAVSRFQRILPSEEYVRAQKFYFEKDRNHWTIAHGTLRMLLSLYTQQNPKDITLQLSPYGKPSLLAADEQPPLQFNLSHSKDLVLYAFTYTQHIGVDIEYIHSGIHYTELARHSFSLAEQTALDAVPLSEKQIAFFKGWTSKEAYVKGRGLGLSLPLHLFDVSLVPKEPAALLASREDAYEVQRWTMHKLELGEGYAGALAVEGPEPSIQYWQWIDDELLCIM